MKNALKHGFNLAACTAGGIAMGVSVPLFLMSLIAEPGSPSTSAGPALFAAGAGLMALGYSRFFGPDISDVKTQNQKSAPSPSTKP